MVALPAVLAVTVSAVVPAFAVELPDRVRVELPLPGAAKLVVLNEAFTPAGSPLTESVTGALNPPTAVTVAVVEPVPV